MERIANPVIYELKYEHKMEPHYEGVQEKHEKLIFNYPTLFIILKKKNFVFILVKRPTLDVVQTNILNRGARNAKIGKNYQE